MQKYNYLKKNHVSKYKSRYCIVYVGKNKLL